MDAKLLNGPPQKMKYETWPTAPSRISGLIKICEQWKLPPPLWVVEIHNQFIRDFMEWHDVNQRPVIEGVDLRGKMRSGKVFCPYSASGNHHDDDNSFDLLIDMISGYNG